MHPIHYSLSTFQNIFILITSEVFPGRNFFGNTPLFFRYSGVKVANAVNAFITTSTAVNTTSVQVEHHESKLAVTPDSKHVFKKLKFQPS